MTKKTIVLAALTATAFLVFGSTPVKADTVTAKNMTPTLRAMYQVDLAESILKEKVAALKACRKNHASSYEIALAQNAVNDATNLVNTLNTMVARDTTLISLTPAGVVNPPTFATNSLAAQGAWSDFIKLEKINHAMAFPISRIPTAAEVSLACKPFSMF